MERREWKVNVEGAFLMVPQEDLYSAESNPYFQSVDKPLVLLLPDMRTAKAYAVRRGNQVGHSVRRSHASAFIVPESCFAAGSDLSSFHRFRSASGEVDVLVPCNRHVIDLGTVPAVEADLSARGQDAGGAVVYCRKMPPEGIDRPDIDTFHSVYWLYRLQGQEGDDPVSVRSVFNPEEEREGLLGSSSDGWSAAAAIFRGVTVRVRKYDGYAGAGCYFDQVSSVEAAAMVPLDRSSGEVGATSSRTALANQLEISLPVEEGRDLVIRRRIRRSYGGTEELLRLRHVGQRPIRLVNMEIDEALGMGLEASEFHGWKTCIDPDVLGLWEMTNYGGSTITVPAVTEDGEFLVAHTGSREGCTGAQVKNFERGV